MEHVTVAPWNMSRSTMMVGSMVCPIYRLNNVKRPTRGGGFLALMAAMVVWLWGWYSSVVGVVVVL